MRIEINPRSLLNLEHICEVLYKLHPSVLNDLVKMERSLGDVLGTIDLDNLSLAEREFLSNTKKEIDYSSPTLEDREINVTHKTFNNKEDFCDFLNKIKEKHKNAKILFDEKHEMAYYGTENQDKSDCFGKEVEPMETNVPVTEPMSYIIENVKEIIKKKEMDEMNELGKTNDKSKLLKKIQELKEDANARRFQDLRKYIQLDTYEYIPMKISVEVEDPVIGKKVKELVEALEKTRAPEQFYLNKKELDEDAYFAEGYGLTMSEEQKKQRDDFFWGEDVEGLKRLLREKSYILKLIFV